MEMDARQQRGRQIAATAKITKRDLFTSTQLVGLWQEAKYGGQKVRREHDWVKVHAVCGVKTSIITAVEVTDRNTQDSPYFAPLITKTMEQFNVARVLGDKAYSSYANLELAVSKGAEPFIPFKSYATGTSRSQTWNKLFGYFMLNREEFLAAYHKRSNVEATFSAIKRVQNESCADQRSLAENIGAQYPFAWFMRSSNWASRRC